MSRPRLHDSLATLFESRDPAQLQLCLNHPDFELFSQVHELAVPAAELREALTHSSFAHEYDIPHQERLEFLGDAVLQLVVSEELLSRLPLEAEGGLSKIRSGLVNEASLATVARHLGLSQLILVGKGEFKKHQHETDTVLADSLEALLGRIYLTRGFALVRERLIGWLEAAHPDVWSATSLRAFDPKSTLQEKSLAKFRKLPVYSAEPEGHNFLVKLWLNDELVASGIYPSKKGGEKELASSVLKQGII